MADGSNGVGLGELAATQRGSTARLCDVAVEQVIVGCCDGCGVVGAVDRGLWRFPYELNMFVSTVSRQLRCVACGCRSIPLQVWPVAPYPEPPRPAFQRWR